MSSNKMSRRSLGSGLLATASVVAVSSGLTAFPMATAWADEHRLATVYRSPSCGCCGAWIDYIEDHGFDVVVHNVEDVVAVKEVAGVPSELYSCHTSAIGGYTVEGHVPIEAIERLLEERPSIQGIGVAGMPAGSPGMGGPATPYTAYAFNRGEIGEPYMTFPLEQ